MNPEIIYPDLYKYPHERAPLTWEHCRETVQRIRHFQDKFESGDIDYKLESFTPESVKWFFGAEVEYDLVRSNPTPQITIREACREITDELEAKLTGDDEHDRVIKEKIWHVLMDFTMKDVINYRIYERLWQEGNDDTQEMDDERMAAGEDPLGIVHHCFGRQEYYDTYNPDATTNSEIRIKAGNPLKTIASYNRVMRIAQEVAESFGYKATMQSIHLSASAHYWDEESGRYINAMRVEDERSAEFYARSMDAILPALADGILLQENYFPSVTQVGAGRKFEASTSRGAPLRLCSNRFEFRGAARQESMPDLATAILNIVGAAEYGLSHTPREMREKYFDTSIYALVAAYNNSRDDHDSASTHIVGASGNYETLRKAYHNLWEKNKINTLYNTVPHAIPGTATFDILKTIQGIGRPDNMFMTIQTPYYFKWTGPDHWDDNMRSLEDNAILQNTFGELLNKHVEELNLHEKYNMFIHCLGDGLNKAYVGESVAAAFAKQEFFELLESASDFQRRSYTMQLIEWLQSNLGATFRHPEYYSRAHMHEFLVALHSQILDSTEYEQIMSAPLHVNGFPR